VSGWFLLGSPVNGSRNTTWQMDVRDGVVLHDGTEAKVLTGIDDHSRFCVAAGRS
jgi:hypothetical protein